ncbi:MAG: hypothetical protein ILP11_00695 [Alphaproteobacteria bacterium]|nr:hypothetical protein [Alphaproteobacteria bacterium]
MKYISLLSLIVLCACTTTQPQQPAPEPTTLDEAVVATDDAVWEEQNMCQEEDEICFVLFASPSNKIYRCSSDDAACIAAMVEAGFTRIGSEAYSPLKDRPFLGFEKEKWGKFVVWQLR